MRYLAGRFVWTLTLSLILVGSCFAQVGIRVNETATRIQIHPDDTIVDLPVENLSHEKVSAHVLLELMDPRGIVQIHADQDASLSAGSTKVKIVLPPAFAQNENPNRRNLLWYRLRYTITANPPSKSIPAPLTGILSVGQATLGIFELHVAGPAFVRENGNYAA